MLGVEVECIARNVCNAELLSVEQSLKRQLLRKKLTIFFGTKLDTIVNIKCLNTVLNEVIL